jgi:hypothetical protein
MSGANPAAEQRIMCHSSPRITTEVYGHLSPGYLQAEVDRLRFGVQPEVEAEEKNAVCEATFGATVVQNSESDVRAETTASAIARDVTENLGGRRGFRTPGSRLVRPVLSR